MPNKNYVNGRSKEYRVMKKLREQGYQVVARTAGSHSKFDVIAIKDGYIRLIQCKPKSMSNLQKQRLTDELQEFDGTYIVETSVI